ncbi:MAG: hypothetical protein Q8N88_07345 [Nanoarchaeota archaeon]|nr:hypothetical protein [Nanoarchaeota archaeon]
MDIENLREKRNGVLRAIENHLVGVYTEIAALKNYQGFREFKLERFVMPDSSDRSVSSAYRGFETFCESKLEGRVDNIRKNLPPAAIFYAIAQAGEYRKRIARQLVKRGIISPNSFIGKCITPAWKSLVNIGKEMIYLGFNDDSLVAELYVFSPVLKSLNQFDK